MHNRRQILALAALALVAPTAALAGEPGQLEAAAKAAVPKGADLKHPILTVDFGVLGPGAVALYAAEDQTTYSGMVTMDAGTQALPPVNEIESRFELTPTAVFTTGDRAGRKALVVLYSYYIDGAGQPEDYAGYVYAWDGAHWAIDDARTQRLAGAKNAKAARARLAKG